MSSWLAHPASDVGDRRVPDQVSVHISNELIVLIVDSDEGCRIEIAGLLEGAGYRTATFAAAEDLLDTVEQLPDRACIISEMNLPGMTGLDLSQHLRERDLSFPVIILTRDSDVATAVNAMRSNVADYLVKPVIERDLINRLRAALAQHSTPNS